MESPMPSSADVTPYPSTEPSRVLLAQAGGPDTDRLRRQLAEDFEVLTSAVDTAEILAAMRIFEPSVIVLDATQRWFPVVRVIKDIRQARAAVGLVVVAADLPDETVLQAIFLDVTGIVIGPAAPAVVSDCVRQVRDGELCLDQAIVRRAVKSLGARLAALREVTAVLTPRELEIVRLVGTGLTNREVAACLLVEEGTIKVHLHNIFYKLQIADRKSLAAYARAKGLGPDDFMG